MKMKCCRGRAEPELVGRGSAPHMKISQQSETTVARSSLSQNTGDHRRLRLHPNGAPGRL